MDGFKLPNCLMPRYDAWASEEIRSLLNEEDSPFVRSLKDCSCCEKIKVVVQRIFYAIKLACMASATCAKLLLRTVCMLREKGCAHFSNLVAAFALPFILLGAAPFGYLPQYSCRWMNKAGTTQDLLKMSPRDLERAYAEGIAEDRLPGLHPLNSDWSKLIAKRTIVTFIKNFDITQVHQHELWDIFKRAFKEEAGDKYSVEGSIDSHGSEHYLNQFVDEHIKWQTPESDKKMSAEATSINEKYTFLLDNAWRTKRSSLVNKLLGKDVRFSDPTAVSKEIIELTAKHNNNKLLYSMGQTAMQLDEKGKQACLVALLKQPAHDIQVTVLKKLLTGQNKISLDTRMEDGETPLTAMIRAGNKPMVQALLDEGAGANQNSRHTFPILQLIDSLGKRQEAENVTTGEKAKQLQNDLEILEVLLKGKARKTDDVDKWIKNIKDETVQAKINQVIIKLHNALSTSGTDEKSPK